MTKTISGATKRFLGIFSAALISALALSVAPSTANAIAAPLWDASGSYVVNLNYLGTDYPHDFVLSQDNAGNLTGTGGSPAGANVYTWVITSGSVSGNTIDFYADYTATADAVTPLTTMHVVATIAEDGSFSGTWNDNYQGGERGGTLGSTSGAATLLPTTGSLTVTNSVVGGGPYQAWDFGLFVDGHSVSSNVATTTLSGAHVVSADVLAHYTNVIGGDCDAAGNVTVPVSGSAACTVTSTYVPPTGNLVIVKNVVAPNGETDVEDATTFSGTVTGPGEFSTSTTFGEGVEAIFKNLVPGDYTVAELAAEGYQLIGISPATTTTVTADATTTVTVTNRQIANTGSLTVHKVVVGGPYQAWDFGLFVDGMAVTRDVATTTSAGNHVVTEDNFPGYQATWSEGCEDGNVSVSPEGSVDCTITNTWVGTGFGTLTVVKIVSGGELGVEDFPLFVGTTSVVSGATTTLPVGEYTVSETGNDNYVATWSENCPDGIATVVSDENVTCTLTNTYTPPTTGGIVVVKNVVGEDGETPVEDGTTFVVRLNGEGPSSEFGEGAEASFSNLEPGSYYVTEDEHEGYETVSISPEEFTVEAGATTTVTITNRQLATTGGLVIEKKVVDENGNDIGDDTSFTVVIDGEISTSIAEGSSATFPAMSLGTHTITENAQDGYELVSISPATTTVSPGATTTVVVTNRRVSSGSSSNPATHHNPGGHRHPGNGGSSGGEVLGASTGPNSCTPYMTNYVWKNGQNNPEQVKLLQEFLNGELGLSLAVNGLYDAPTQAAVGQFQVKYGADVLQPWVDLGLWPNAQTPSYNVFKTTLWKINDIKCPGTPKPIVP